MVIEKVQTAYITCEFPGGVSYTGSEIINVHKTKEQREHNKALFPNPNQNNNGSFVLHHLSLVHESLPEFPLYPRSKHGLSKNTLIFPTFAVAQNLHFLLLNCIVFDPNYFCNSYQVCPFFQVGLQRFSKKCPTLNICA